LDQCLPVWAVISQATAGCLSGEILTIGIRARLTILARAHKGTRVRL
jgi:hypothetical protein